MKKIYILSFFSIIPVISLLAQENNGDAPKEGENRNVMLNASSANGPREIQIGLPAADVNVLENGLPVTYATYPHTVNTNWRGDASHSQIGVMSISETAITTGNVGYAVNSFTKLGEEGFHGLLNYKANHFGLQEYSLNLNGSFGKGWYYSANMYQDFDPGTFDIKSSRLQDRTQIYKAAITRRYDGGRGELTAMFHYSNSHNVYNYATESAPFVYVGDGSVKEYGEFRLGTTSYLPIDGNMVYRDMRTGELKETSFYDATENYSSQFYLSHKYKWDNGLMWKTITRYDKARGALVYQSPMSLFNVKDNPAYNYVQPTVNGDIKPYSGEYIQSRMATVNVGYIDEFFLTTEIWKKSENSTFRLGLNEWYYNIDYTSCTSMFDQSVPVDGSHPVRLYNANKRNTVFYDLNKNASQYDKGHENKLAVYFTHNWDITPNLNVSYGARAEWQLLKGENCTPKNAEGEYVGRFPDFWLGATAPDGTKIYTTPLDFNWFNYDLSAAATYKINKRFGLTADFTYIVQHPRLDNLSTATNPEMKSVNIPLARAGIYFNTPYISLTSMLSYVSKSNNIATLNLQHDQEIMAAPLAFDIQTIGWTTDVLAHPFTGFDFHFLFTYQKPTYKKYETSVTFSDGYEGHINATGNIVADIPQVLVELDPSYKITDNLKFWLSFRYFSKTYANINDAYFFKGHWETFGGLNWQVSKKLSLGCSVVNFLNQTGAKGTIAGAELITKEDAKGIKNALMTGSYLRPFTVEFSASLNF